MASKVEELLEECNKKIKCNRFNLLIWSFMNDFNELQNISLFDEVDKDDLDKFIKICNNRLERSKIFLKDIAVVMGFDFVALSIIVTAVESSIFRLLFKSPTYYIIFIFLVIVVFIFLFILLTHYRSQVHAWTAFKEIALIKCPDGKKSKTKEEE